MDGEKITLADLRGEVVVINFWATWCAPCREELPLLDAYYRAQQKFGLRVFAVTTEGSVPDRKLKPLFEKLDIQQVRRVNGPYRDLGAIPTNFVIDRSGVVRFAKAHQFDLDDLNTILVPLLNERAPES